MLALHSATTMQPMQTVNILAHGEGKAHIPYRQNRLTAVLKAALGGNSRSTMLVHVWPEATQLEEAVTTLRFAECMRRLQTAPQKEVAADPEVLLRRCQQQVCAFCVCCTPQDMLCHSLLCFRSVQRTQLNPGMHCCGSQA